MICTGRYPGDRRESLVEKPAIAHLKMDLRILDEMHHIRRLLAVHVGNQFDQCLPHRVFDFGRDFIEPEFTLYLNALAADSGESRSEHGICPVKVIPCRPPAVHRPGLDRSGLQISGPG